VSAKATPTPAQRVDRRSRAARAEGRDAREALLDAALEVFARRGLRGASIDEIAAQAGFSKGAVYWHFAGKDELFLALLEERLDRPFREMIALLQSAPPEQDMAPEASRRFGEVLAEQRQLLLLEHEYWSAAVRDPSLRPRYVKRQAELRSALAAALEARARHLGAPPFDTPVEGVATAFVGLARGLAQEKLIEPGAVPDRLLGEIMALVYLGLVTRASSG
jgi:AcrR family transcriptional regulator